MNKQEFEALVSEIGFSSVPEKFRGFISNVALIIEDDVSTELRREMKLPLNETLLGLYRGIPLAARGDGYGIGGRLPDTIALYRLPIIEAAAEDGITVRQMIEETIWHEVAHHFGLNEEEVRKREKENKN
ncbi:MAG: metallopeptidase family protein [Candidatus Pacebacteria bacterium]|nr:metallopeptidase family protein [Candidatus Paceibacterota bacterium]